MVCDRVTAAKLFDNSDFVFGKLSIVFLSTVNRPTVVQVYNDVE